MSASGLTVRVSYLRVQTYLRGSDKRYSDILEQWKDEGSQELLEQMMIKTPVSKKPTGGFLKQSITRKKTPKGFSVYPAASYAVFVEKDTKPHVIFPRQAGGILRWYGDNGQPIFARYVRHPGTKGQWFVKKTNEMMKPVLKQMFLMIWREHQ